MRSAPRAAISFAAFLLLAPAAILSVAPRAAALVVPLTFVQMTQRSKLVLTGEVLELRSYRAPFLDLGEVIFTDVTIRVENVYKGVPAGKEVTVQVLGGEIGDAFQKCLESPRYQKGERLLVFLRDFNDALWTTGWLQGKYVLDASGSVVKGAEDLPIPRDVPLATVAADVKSYSASTAPGSGGSGREGGAK